MAYDADGNFYNPYQPGTFEYDYEESQRSQPTVELTPEQQAQEIASQNQYRDFLASNPAYVARAEAIAAEYNKPQTSWMDTFGSTVLAVALLVNPTIGLSLGSAILGSSATGVGAAVGLSATQVASAVGASALSAATTALSGGTVEDVIRNAAGAGVASGLNFGMGGGVSGAVTGSVAGTILKGGDASQVLTNAFAAGVGAGVQGAMTENPDAGKIIGSAARTYIATGGDMDQTLLNTAATAIGTLDKPTTYAKTTTAQPAPGSAPFQYGNDTYQELDDGTAKVTTQSGNVRILSADTFNEIKQDYAADVAAGAVPPPAGPVIPPQTVVAPAPAATLPPVTVTAPIIAPTVTDVDVMKQVAAEQPATALPPVTVTSKPEEPAPTSIRLTLTGPESDSALAPAETLAPVTPPTGPVFETKTIAETSPIVSPVVTDLDLVKQVAAQPTPTVDPKELERVIVQGQGANVANAASVVAPTVTGTDLINQVAEQPAPTVEPKALEKVIVQGQRETANVANVAPVSTEITAPRPDTTAGLPTPAVDQQTLQQVIVQGQGANVANVAPVETTVPSTTVPSTVAVATPTPAQPFPTPTITPVAEPEKEAPVVTDIPSVEPPQTEFERRFINETVAAPVTTGPELQQVTVRETVPRPVEPVEFEQKTIQETVPRVSDVVAETPAPPPVAPPPVAPPPAAPPSAAPPTELEQVTVRETVPKVSDVVTDVPVPPVEPPPAPPPPPAPEVKAEEPKKEEPKKEPKKEAKKLYPTVTSVPPPKRPGRQPIITGASPARLLADALAAYRPAGAIEGEESGKERQNVWNEKSLRLKDALGL